MATFSERVPENVQGRYYVDNSRTDCSLCRDISPVNFARADEHGVSYVKKQPANPDEEMWCREAVQACPHESIGDDGEKYDWAAIPPCDMAATYESYQEHLNSFPEEEKQSKSWWKFW